MLKVICGGTSFHTVVGATDFSLFQKKGFNFLIGREGLRVVLKVGWPGSGGGGGGGGATPDSGENGGGAGGGGAKGTECTPGGGGAGGETGGKGGSEMLGWDSD